MRIDIISIFPEYFTPLEVSLVGKARERGILDIRLHQLRDWTHDVHKTVDDTPYGGGPGMVMKPEVWGEAIDAVIAQGGPEGAGLPRMIVPTPSGRPFTQRVALEYAREPWLLFTPARYEGIDARVVDEYRSRLRVDEVSIGDYVLAGGEAAVLVIVETVARLLPGVIGNAQSVADDSFAPGPMENLLEGPVYTKPPVWRGHPVPEILLSGHHARIARWRRDQALRRTFEMRPDLIARLDPESLDERDREVLAECRERHEAAAFRAGPQSMAD
ncbi:tRNA (guanine-N(1)-)-methyltransferase [Thermobispora bispora]|jgi:tRNA (guanine37-N1)-methyltransferase|uniref:tRNA (guanosine(37)-N1)-methyltransferase TrmD n=1 Tax=Thermobispora bispora TaxID=2006 RepID=UPI001982176A|nr:tRNA (guanosine(37)-N1)-methyltransferase TrmD [Thermobispora bispora]MBO2473043.1 tRNA (guanosine(37)-N1)-methyltransferase TrmD [Actinomycetales bacterium]MBX6166554.1 tRNA (guanosine(37)-N1)-methyltransferase TrmD [Thermobispora bispora]QSI47612.1 tRNA (guanosine(37)-N1)-methyltransferase TrmD [Thermobispora bispora]